MPARCPPRSWFVPLIVIAGLYLLIVTLTVFKMSNDDIWIHLKTGERIVQTGHVPHKDPYSFSASDHDYVAHEWLSAVLFYIVYAAAGVNGLILFKHAVVVATCAILYLISRLRGDHLGLWIPCFVLMLMIASARFLERPHIFSYLFTALYLLVYALYRQGGRRWVLATLPPLQALWANMHGGHLTGVLLLATIAVAELATSVRARLRPLPEDRPLPPRELVKLALLPVACLAAALVNPYGWRLLTFPFALTGLEVFMRGELGIVEWQGLLHPVYTSTAMFALYVPWVALLLGSQILSGDNRRLPASLRAASRAFQLVTAAFAALFVYQLARAYGGTPSADAMDRAAAYWVAALALVVLARLHRLDLVDLGVSAIFLALSFRYNRAVTDAVVATLPVVSHHLSRLWDRFAGAPPRALAAGGGVLAMAVALATASGGYHFSFSPPRVREAGLGVASNVAKGAVDYLARNHVYGRALTSYSVGGLMIHDLWPAVRVGMDSRNDVYGEALYREYRAAFEGGPALETYLAKWSIDLVVVTNTVPPPFPFLYFFEQSEDWALVYADSLSLVYVRRLDRFREIIDRDEPPLMNPNRRNVPSG